MIFNFVCCEGKVYHDKVKNTRIVHVGNNNIDPLKKRYFSNSGLSTAYPSFSKFQFCIYFLQKVLLGCLNPG